MTKKIFFGAHGSILQVFCELDRRLRASGDICKSAYWISDSRFYFANRELLPALNDTSVKQLHEWNFTNTSGSYSTDPSRCNELDKRYGAYDFWKAIIADRRLMYGRLSKIRQSYTSHFNHQELCRIVYTTLDAMDRLVVQMAPDAIITFVPATYGDYLLALIAKARNIRYLQLRSTKIKNFILFSDSLDAVASTIDTRYRNNLQSGAGFPCEAAATDYIAQAMSTPVDYEGTIARSKLPLTRRLTDGSIKLAGALRNRFLPPNKAVAFDNHVPPPVSTWLHATLLKARHRRATMKCMNHRMLSLDDAKEVPYVFYPLHSEPEIALSVYGRDHQNQIESIRRLAQSLPLRWRLIVKEHPNSMGYRRPGYYQRLLEIPNLWFAAPDTRPFYWIEQARAVATVSGFVGFEALMIGRPVLVMGNVSYSLMPRHMLRIIGPLSDISSQLEDLLNKFHRDELALRSFVAACMYEGVQINLYSDLLDKPARNRPDELNIEEQYERLSLHLSGKLKDYTTQRNTRSG